MRKPKIDNYYGFTRYDGPSAIVAGCHYCKFSDKVNKSEPSPGKPRGWGMYHGNKQRGRMIQHAKEMHPEKVGTKK